MGKGSYSPLLDFFLRNCKRNQKSGLLVRGGVPGDGQTLGALPPCPTACLPKSGHQVALNSPSQELCVRTSHRGQRWPIPSPHPLCCWQDCPAEPPTHGAGFSPPAWGGQAALSCPRWTFNIHSSHLAVPGTAQAEKELASLGTRWPCLQVRGQPKG